MTVSLNKRINDFITSAKVDNFLFVVLCATLFTTGMCHALIDISYKSFLEEMGGILVDLKWVAVLESVISIYYIIRKKCIDFDFGLVIFIQAYVLIEVLDYQRQVYSDIVYAWILPMSYIVCKLVISMSPSIKEANRRIVTMYGSLAVGWFIAVSADILNDFRLAPIYGFQTEVWNSFWIPTVDENRTTFEFGFVLASATVGFAIYLIRKNKPVAFLIMVANAFAQVLAIKVEGRENSLLIMFSITFTIFMLIVDNWKKVNHKIRKIIVYVIIAIALLVALYCIAFFNNWFGIADIYYNSYWSGSGGLFTNVRFRYDIGGFKGMLNYPLDNFRGFPGTEKPHAMVLEFGRVYGFTIYVLLWVFILCCYKDALKLFVKNDENSWIKYLILPGFICVYLYYAMEPNGLVFKSFWMVGLCINGMIRGWLELYEKKHII